MSRSRWSRPSYWPSTFAGSARHCNGGSTPGKVTVASSRSLHPTWSTGLPTDLPGIPPPLRTSPAGSLAYRPQRVPVEGTSVLRGPTRSTSVTLHQDHDRRPNPSATFSPTGSRAYRTGTWESSRRQTPGTVMSLAAGFGAPALGMILAAGASPWLHQTVESGDLLPNDSDHDSDHMESDA